MNVLIELAPIRCFKNGTGCQLRIIQFHCMAIIRPRTSIYQILLLHLNFSYLSTHHQLEIKSCYTSPLRNVSLKSYFHLFILKELRKCPRSQNPSQQNVKYEVRCFIYNCQEYFSRVILWILHLSKFQIPPNAIRRQKLLDRFH